MKSNRWCHRRHRIPSWPHFHPSHHLAGRSQALSLGPGLRYTVRSLYGRSSAPPRWATESDTGREAGGGEEMLPPRGSDWLGDLRKAEASLLCALVWLPAHSPARTGIKQGEARITTKTKTKAAKCPRNVIGKLRYREVKLCVMLTVTEPRGGGRDW